MLKEMKAKFNCKCSETGKKIKKGEWIIYNKNSKKAYCFDSKEYQTYREHYMDEYIL